MESIITQIPQWVKNTTIQLESLSWRYILKLYLTLLSDNISDICFCCSFYIMFGHSFYPQKFQRNFNKDVFDK